MQDVKKFIMGALMGLSVALTIMGMLSRHDSQRELDLHNRLYLKNLELQECGELLGEKS